MKLTPSPTFSLFWLAMALLWGGILAPPALPQENIIVLKNGMTIKGQYNVMPRGSLDDSKHSKGTEAGTLAVVDDGLRATFLHNNSIATANPTDPLLSIPLNNAKRRSTDGRPLQGISASQGTDFNQFGRRLTQVRTVGGSHELVQGITEITPVYLRVESMRSEKGTPLWDMRIAIQSIPPKLLVDILTTNANRQSEQEWLDIISLLNQAKMYPEAIDVLERSIRELPEMAVHRKNLALFAQAIADQMFDEVQLRRNAGQYDLANALLRGFRPENMTVETQIKIQKRLTEDQSEQLRIKQIIESLSKQIQQLDDAALQMAVEPIRAEIAEKLSSNTLNRMVDYERLKDDDSMKLESRVAMGISGWIAGSGLTIENLGLAKSLIQTRELVAKFLSNTSEVQRRDLLQQIKKLEAGSPRFIAPLVAHMLPAIPLPSPTESDPTRFKIDIPVSQLDGEQVSYYLQLPPQYDPYRSYPCILALHGGGTAETELNWWAGRYSEEWKMADGQASRHGFVVVSPMWKNPDSSLYQSTENEHARALACLRDAMRRTNVDSNRVYVGGHYSGAMLAWDLALSHPDLWAGAVAIGLGTPTPFIKHYHESARYVPLYFVSGELDGAPGPRIRFGAALDDYMQFSRNDVLYVQYNGRGSDMFVEELPRIMQWMNLASHTRIPPPKSNITLRSARPGDNFFWWLEVNEFNNDKMNHPLLKFLPNRVADLKFERNPQSNTFTFSALPAQKFTLWLDPSTADFTKKIKVIQKRDKNVEVTPNVEVLLEDVRTRADRLRPFWAKVEID